MPLDALYQKIEHAKIKCLQKDPFLAGLLNHWVIELSDIHSTAATDGQKIYFGREFLRAKTSKEVLFVLLHELLHILLNHLPRRIGRHPQRFNVACDIVVNDLLVHHGYDPGKLPVILGNKYAMRGDRLHVEEIYDALPVKLSEGSLDDHSLWENLDETTIKDILERFNGASLSESPLYRRLIKPSENPVHPLLTDILSQFLAVSITDYTYNRIDTRFQDVILPSFSQAHEQLENIWLVIDVSGSMRKDVLAQLYGQLETIIARYPAVDLAVSFFSNIITEPVKVYSSEALHEAFLNVESTGGTDFSTIFDSYSQFFPEGYPLANIIVTDGYGIAPPKRLDPGNQTWWAITEAKSFTPQFGTRVSLKGAFDA